MKEDGEWRSRNTGLRADSPVDTRRARLLAEERTWHESESAPGTASGWSWVRAWLKSSALSTLSEVSYAGRWRHVAEFLDEREILSPAAVRHEHAQEYVEWRMAQSRPNGKLISRNTAVAEAKLWKSVMLEAVNRGLIDASPLAKAKLRRDTPAEKPEVTPEEQATIEAALASEPVWMRRAWQIAMATGCRLRETRIELRNVDLPRGTIYFPAPKGGRKKAYSIPLPASLRPLFEAMREAGERVTLEFPDQPSRAWGHFFNRVGLPHLCFHCSRVSFITRLSRAGAPLAVAMRLVNHASTSIHRIYQRTTLDDLAGWAERVESATGATPQSPPAKPAGPASGSRAKRRRSAPARR